jgi:hypothetical protein
VLHGVIREHLDDFLRAAADRADGAGLPEFIAREFREFLTCGVLAHGFARVRCEQCAFERLVPFSCKGRGFCPSCVGRRMTERAAHLVDEVVPPVPVRQWVLTALPAAVPLGVGSRAEPGCARGPCPGVARLLSPAGRETEHPGGPHRDRDRRSPRRPWRSPASWAPPCRGAWPWASGRGLRCAGWATRGAKRAAARAARATHTWRASICTRTCGWVPTIRHD